MADSLYKTNTTRINMFDPLSTTNTIMDKVTLLLKQIDNGNPKYCDLHYERMARRVAAIIVNFKHYYNLNIRQLEEKYNLNDLRKSFACKGINLYELVDSIITYDNILANENPNAITTHDNLIIKINL